MKKATIIKFLASGLYSGYSPLWPGTTGTIPAWLIAYFLVGNNTNILLAVTGVMIVLSIYLAGQAEKYFGHDAKKIVIDEWAGMMISVLLVPFSLLNYIIAFGAFRAFDAVKIYPANVAEKLPRGWGVTADDIVAGVQANLLTQVIIYFFSTHFKTGM
jgi:phosphatidylglycerophosphatase A